MDFYKEHITGNKAIVDQNFNKYELKRYYDEKRIIEPLITADLQNMSEKLGTGFTGLIYSVKTASSIEDKLDRAQEEIAKDRKKIFYTRGR